MSARWNHRIVFKDGKFAIHECHYDEAMNPVAITKNPSPISENSIEDLKDALIRALHSTTIPVLKYEDFNSYKKSVYETGGSNVDDYGEIQ